MDNNLENITNHESDIEELNTLITSSLVSAAGTTIPKSNMQVKNQSLWWKTNCERAIRRKRAAFLKMKKFKTNLLPKTFFKILHDSNAVDNCA